MEGRRLTYDQLMPAIHGFWCGAVTWPTRCPTCSERVFYFHCNCGSKVFFDELGDPWPKHQCFAAWGRTLKRTRGSGGSVTVELSEWVTAFRPPLGSIHNEVVSSEKRRREWPPPIVAISPRVHDEEVAVTGVVREVRRGVDVYEAFNLDPTPMSAAFLEALGEGDWGKVTIHVPTPQAATLHSYTAWIPNEILDNPQHSRGATVEAVLRGFAVPGRDTSAWACDQYTIIGITLSSI